MKNFLSLFSPFVALALLASTTVFAESTVIRCTGSDSDDDGKVYDLSLTLDPELKSEAIVGYTLDGSWSIVSQQTFDRTQAAGPYFILDRPTAFESNTAKQEIDSVTVESSKNVLNVQVTEKRYTFSSTSFKVKVLGPSVPSNRIIFKGCKAD